MSGNAKCLAGMCVTNLADSNPYAGLLILDEPAAAPLDIAQEALLYKLIERVVR